MRVADITVRGVSSIAILIHQIPELLRREVEHLRSSTIPCADAALVEIVEWCLGSLRKVAEVGIAKIVSGRLCSAEEYVILAVVLNDTWILDSGNVASIVLGTNLCCVSRLCGRDEISFD